MKISGLTKRQYKMMSIMWDLKTAEEYHNWSSTLSRSEFRESIVLKNLMIAGYIDLETQDCTEFPQVAKLLESLFK